VKKLIFTHFGCNILASGHPQGSKEGRKETARTASGPGLAAAASHTRTRAHEEKRPVRRMGIRPTPLTPTFPYIIWTSRNWIWEHRELDYDQWDIK